MKKIIVISACAVFGLALLAQTASPKKELTPEEKAARMQRMMEKTGGILKVPGSGKIVILNNQKRIPASKIEADAAVIAKAIRAMVEVQNCDTAFSVPAAAELVRKSGGEAVVFITDNPSYPMSLVAMEANWGMMNLAPLGADNPTPEKFARRASRELLRTTTVTIGGATSANQASAMQTVQCAADLDKIVSDGIAFDALRNILTHLPKIGVKPPRMSTYKKACQEGWAPAPTNDFQRAILEQVKNDKERGPSNPLKIVPPSAKK